MKTERITESELVLPSLFIMTMQEDGKITTSDLIQELTKIIKPTGIDAELLSGRNDSHFSQIVRNLKSHRTFERYGYAENIDNGFRITPQGKQFVNAKSDIIQYMFNSIGFNIDDILVNCKTLLSSTPDRKVIPLMETIREGSVKKISHSIYERSLRLRNYAKEYFTKEDGLLYCECCNFEFSHFYKVYPNSCIEIHHIKPLYQYEDEDITKTIEACLLNLIPVCPNCHRVIHRNHITDKQNIEKFKHDINPFNY